MGCTFSKVYLTILYCRLFLAAEYGGCNQLIWTSPLNKRIHVPTIPLSGAYIYLHFGIIWVKVGLRVNPDPQETSIDTPIPMPPYTCVRIHIIVLVGIGFDGY